MLYNIKKNPFVTSTLNLLTILIVIYYPGDSAYWIPKIFIILYIKSLIKLNSI